MKSLKSLNDQISREKSPQIESDIWITGLGCDTAIVILLAGHPNVAFLAPREAPAEKKVMYFSVIAGHCMIFCGVCR